MKIIKLLEFLENNLDLQEFLHKNPDYSPQEIKEIFKKLKDIYIKYHQTPYELYIDGASRGNPGKASVGFVIFKNGQEVVRDGKYIGIKTNNEAEYFALLLGLKKCLDLGINNIKIYSDSKLLVNQINGTYKIKDEKLKRLYKEIEKILKNINYKIEHIPREKNKIADNMANQILDDAI